MSNQWAKTKDEKFYCGDCKTHKEYINCLEKYFGPLPDGTGPEYSKTYPKLKKKDIPLLNAWYRSHMSD